ncbi:methylenetetrahydrofolate reductase [NAD(P)H] [Clostridium aestuarii]|uniref:Methylenetetrahydrofolate reductase n=1 Tax=Clostridium aestuarii TaxID=338193 RepID=A0ABT4D1D0_9CLOT|nr:methylenetetrahydrofolate reductase [NAD(P)H] [Clostridium aestuarii]MCY6485031.1 methylenetetrahydrofolate reductase [NAD(P)H] [Clostridium aestuarii]
MNIKDIFKQKKPVISFEIFPPRKDSSINTIYKTIDNLAYLKPDYISVTYGASGNKNKNKTTEIASIVKNKYNIEALAHLTCLTSSKDEINKILQQLKNNNIENLLALRGDLPEEPDFKISDSNPFNYAVDLIKHIKETEDFCIGGACYPEGHTECNSIESDLYNLKNKVNSGTDFLISQLFFDNKFFYDFKSKVDTLDINVPLQAGIMPVINKKQIERIVSLCGTSIPKKFITIMNKYENNTEALKDAGIAYATDQIIDLLSNGIDGIHIYTMNNPDVARKIVSNISSVVNALNTDIAI